MSINATGYVLNCQDRGGCDNELRDTNFFNLRDTAVLSGWQLDVKLNGERAIHGGKDYCPAHRKGAAS